MGLSLHLKGAYEAGFNPAKSLYDDSQSDNPLQSFFDPANAFGGLLTGMPGLPALPSTPSWAVKYMTHPYTKTNFGSFSTPSMQDTPDSLHASVHAPSGTSSGGTGTTGTTGGAAPPGVPGVPGKPVNPGPPGGIGGGGIGVGIQPRSQIFNGGQSEALAAHYAQTPNNVVSQSSMVAPVVSGARPMMAK